MDGRSGSESLTLELGPSHARSFSPSRKGPVERPATVKPPALPWRLLLDYVICRCGVDLPSRSTPQREREALLRRQLHIVDCHPPLPGTRIHPNADRGAAEGGYRHRIQVIDSIGHDRH